MPLGRSNTLARLCIADITSATSLERCHGLADHDEQPVSVSRAPPILIDVRTLLPFPSAVLTDSSLFSLAIADSHQIRRALLTFLDTAGLNSALTSFFRYFFFPSIPFFLSFFHLFFFGFLLI